MQEEEGKQKANPPKRNAQNTLKKKTNKENDAHKKKRYRIHGDERNIIFIYGTDI